MSAPDKPLVRIEGQYRRFLSSRWAGLVVRSAILNAVVLLIVPGVLVSHDTSALAILGTLVAGPIIYLFTTHLVLRAKRSTFLRPPRPTSSPFPLPTALASISAHATYLASYSAFGTLFALAYARLLIFRAADANLGLFAPTSRHPWHINERLFFLVVANTLLCTLLGARDVLSSSLLPVWPARRTRFADAAKAALGTSAASVVADLVFGAGFTLAYPIVYFALRRTAWRLTVSYLPFVRPFIFNFSKPAAPLALTYHLAVLVLTATLAVRVPAGLVATYLTEPLRYEALTRKSPLSPDRYLLTALQSSDPYHLNLTIQEVQRVAHLPARRKALFADLSRSPPPLRELWHALLLDLARAHAALAPPRAAAAPRPATPPADRHSIALKQADIFRPVSRQKSMLALAVQGVLDRPGTASVTVATPALPGQARAIAGAKKIETAVAKSIEGPVAHAKAAPVVKRSLGLYHTAAGAATAWTAQTWARRSVRTRVPEPDRLARLVDIFATLAVVSIDEDTYGLVQAVLPGTLEALVRLRAGLLRAAAELAAAGGDAQELDAAITPLVRAIDDGVRRVADAFGDSLAAFRFPPAIAQSLTDICR
ncbi:hypothetical protein Q5752_002517 [Cryptotrichosporon argae]